MEVYVYIIIGVVVALIVGIVIYLIVSSKKVQTEDMLARLTELGKKVEAAGNCPEFMSVRDDLKQFEIDFNEYAKGKIPPKDMETLTSLLKQMMDEAQAGIQSKCEMT